MSTPGLPPASQLEAELETGAARLNGQPHPTSLEQRLATTRVDLLKLIADGIPDREWLPASHRMLARGARHHVAAPLKSGKSLSLLTHVVDMLTAGARVDILDRENGADEYARRLRDILADRPATTTHAVRDRLRYYAWPEIRLDDGSAIAAALADADLVVLDSTRTFLSALGLGEDSSDDFARYAAALIDPLFRAGVTTIQLDNTGHGDTGRARGSSSKGDLADVAYTLKTTTGFDAHRRGAVRLERKASRFGDVAPAFTMELGDGHFGSFTPDDTAEPADTFRPTGQMERVSHALEQNPGLTKRAIRQTVKGKNDWIDLALELLIAEGHVRAERDGQATLHHTTNPYREADDETHRAPVPQPCPNRAPGTGTSDRAPVPPPLRARGTGHRSPGTPTTLDRAPTEEPPS